jgi:anti-sigma factor RsiW
VTDVDKPTEPDGPLTETQQLLMTYIDDEMDRAQRAAFEKRLADDPELAAEAAEFQELMDMTQSMAVIEPTEHEMRRFWSRFYNRAEWRLGWVLLVLGLLVLLLEGLFELIRTDIVGWHIKTAAISALVGGVLLLWNTVRLKIRTSRFDRYRGVMR